MLNLWWTFFIKLAENRTTNLKNRLNHSYLSPTLTTGAEKFHHWEDLRRTPYNGCSITISKSNQVLYFDRGQESIGAVFGFLNKLFCFRKSFLKTIIFVYPWLKSTVETDNFIIKEIISQENKKQRRIVT